MFVVGQTILRQMGNFEQFHLLLRKPKLMNTTLNLGPLVSLLAGVLILIVSRMLNYIVAAYLIIIGLLGLFGDIHLR